MNTRTVIPMLPAPKNRLFPARTIRTFLAEDCPMMMMMLARTLAKDKRTLIIGSASDGRKAFGHASSLQPDLVMTDLHMPGLDGAEATRLLKQRPNPPVIFVVTSDGTGGWYIGGDFTSVGGVARENSEIQAEPAVDERPGQDHPELLVRAEVARSQSQSERQPQVEIRSARHHVLEFHLGQPGVRSDLLRRITIK